MARIRNVSAIGALEIPDLGVVVEHGDEIEVTDEVARSLAEQPANWRLVKAKAAKSEEG
jgi:hypothetical protein